MQPNLQGGYNLQNNPYYWTPNSTATSNNLQGSTSTQTTLQGTGQPQKTGSLQVTSSPQNTGNPMGYVDPVASGGQTLGVNTTVDPNAAAKAAADAEAAAKAAQAGKLRTDITDLINRIKDTFNSRYGQTDQAAAEQLGKLNERFGTESGDITRQVGSETEKVGAGAASAGTYDSSYRGNNVDTVTKAGEAQIRDLGTELQDNVGKVGQFVASTKAGYDSQKTGLDAVLSRLAESTDPNELAQIRNTLEGRIASLKGEEAANNTAAQNSAALASIAPTTARSVQLKTTLSQIVAGNADKSQKAAIGEKLIQNAGLSPEEAQKLLIAFQSDVSSTEQKQQTA